MDIRPILAGIASSVFLAAMAFPASAGEKPPESQSVSLEGVLAGAVSPFAKYCDGYGNNGASGNGYISVLTLGAGCVKSDMDPVLEGIVSYDRAETNDTYIGQINMITASSFCGLNGAVWGYHLAKSDALAEGKVKPLFIHEGKDGSRMTVYPVEPLLDAGRRLFGINSQRRFPMLPGAHVICATKDVTAQGPCHIWAAIAIAMAADREKDSNLFIEDCGKCGEFKSEAERKAYFDKLIRDIVECVARCGKDNDARYTEVFVGFKEAWIPEGSTGCALVAAPYVTLPKDAIPSGGAARLLDMRISEWEKELKLPPLP